MGGSVGLKGTDGVAAEAARLGAVRHSGDRAAAALKELLPFGGEMTVLCASGEMGESLVPMSSACMRPGRKRPRTTPDALRRR